MSGAPGSAWFCSNGHLRWWLDPGQEVSDEQVEAMEQGCDCGARRFVRIPHYGQLGDCLQPGQRTQWIGRCRFSRTVRVAGAHDGQGRPVRAFVDRVTEYEQYRLIGFDIPPGA